MTLTGNDNQQAPELDNSEVLQVDGREWGKARSFVFFALAVVFLLLHVAVALIGEPAPLERRALHVGIGLALLLIALPTLGSARGAKRWVGIAIDSLAMCLLAAHCWYFLMNADQIFRNAGAVKSFEVVMGIAVIVILIEGTRRTIGWGLVALVLAALAYGFWGQYIPGAWGHGGFSLERLVGHLYLGFNGIFGAPTSASVEFIYLFLILAAILTAVGASGALSDMATALFGKVRGGPGKVAVVGSGLFGSISGSAAANTASTGGFTIPMMIRSGIQPRVAASIEAVSSVGGQFVPPVMGASAFIMAEFLGVPYATILLAAILPALLYYIAIFMIVDFYAARHKMAGVESAVVSAARARVGRQLFLLVPLGVVIVCIAVLQMTPQRSAVVAIVSGIIVGLCTKTVRQKLRRTGHTVILEGTKVALPVITAVGASGIIIGIVSLTGLGTKLSSLLIASAGDNLFVLLLLTMIASLVLGAGLPTVPTYVLLATLVAPAMIDSGVHPIAAHMFIFFYGALADLTPPTAVSVVIASGIAKTNSLRTMFTATRVGAIGYVIPFLFVYHSTLILQGGFTLHGVLTTIVAVSVCLVAAVAISERWLGRDISIVSSVILAGAVALTMQTDWLPLIGAALLVLFVAGITRFAHSARAPRLIAKVFAGAGPRRAEEPVDAGGVA